MNCIILLAFLILGTIIHISKAKSNHKIYVWSFIFILAIIFAFPNKSILTEMFETTTPTMDPSLTTTTPTMDPTTTPTMDPSTTPPNTDPASVITAPVVIPAEMPIVVPTIASMTNSTAPTVSQTTEVDAETVSKILNSTGYHRNSHSNSHTVIEDDKMPSVTQTGLKGISNIFTPQITITERNKDADIGFKVNDKLKGKIIPDNIDWKTPKIDIWEASNILDEEIEGQIDGGMNNQNNNGLDGPYYWNVTNKTLEKQYVPNSMAYYWNTMYGYWADKNGNQIELPDEIKMAIGINQERSTKLNPNVDPSVKFTPKVKGEKCSSYVVPYREDDESMFNEGVKNKTGKDFYPGYSYVNPGKWDVPQKRPPVCLTSYTNKNMPSATFTSGTPVNVLELDKTGRIAMTENDVTQTNVGSILPKFKFQTLQ